MYCYILLVSLGGVRSGLISPSEFSQIKSMNVYIWYRHKPYKLPLKVAHYSMHLSTANHDVGTRYHRALYQWSIRFHVTPIKKPAT